MEQAVNQSICTCEEAGPMAPLCLWSSRLLTTLLELLQIFHVSFSKQPGISLNAGLFLLDSVARSLNLQRTPGLSSLLKKKKKKIIPSVQKRKDVILTNIEKCILLVSEAVIGMCLVFK